MSVLDRTDCARCGAKRDDHRPEKPRGIEDRCEGFKPFPKPSRDNTVRGYWVDPTWPLAQWRERAVPVVLMILEQFHRSEAARRSILPHCSVLCSTPPEGRAALWLPALQVFNGRYGFVGTVKAGLYRVAFRADRHRQHFDLPIHDPADLAAQALMVAVEMACVALGMSQDDEYGPDWLWREIGFNQRGDFVMIGTGGIIVGNGLRGEVCSLRGDEAMEWARRQLRQPVVDIRVVEVP